MRQAACQAALADLLKTFDTFQGKARTESASDENAN